MRKLKYQTTVPITGTNLNLERVRIAVAKWRAQWIRYNDRLNRDILN